MLPPFNSDAISDLFCRTVAYNVMDRMPMLAKWISDLMDSKMPQNDESEDATPSFPGMLTIHSSGNASARTIPLIRCPHLTAASPP